MYTEQDDAIIFDTGPAPGMAVIWLHGLGADGHDFLPVVEQLRLPPELAIRFIFPHAPVRSITVNQGYRMRGWYDIRSLDLAEAEDSAGIEASSRAITERCIILQEDGFAASDIVIAGFSQGGVVALHCALNAPGPMAGIIALSCYTPVCLDTASPRVQKNRDLPIFMAHGQIDEIIALEHGRQSRNCLQAAGFAVEWHEYAMGHAVCPAEIAHIRQWLISRATGR